MANLKNIADYIDNTSEFLVDGNRVLSLVQINRF
jgi:hypothetical protein